MTHISGDTWRSQKIHTESLLLFMSDLWRSKGKLYPPKKPNGVLFSSSSWSFSIFVCLILLLRSSDEYEKETSEFSIISFYRQFGQLNSHLIIITKEQQEDKSTEIRFYRGANVSKGSVPSTHGFGRSMSTACAFQQDRDCVRFTTCATLPKITHSVTPQTYTVLPEQELGMSNWKGVMNINKKWMYIEAFHQ